MISNGNNGSKIDSEGGQTIVVDKDCMIPVSGHSSKRAVVDAFEQSPMGILARGSPSNPAEVAVKCAG